MGSYSKDLRLKVLTATDRAGQASQKSRVRGTSAVFAGDSSHARLFVFLMN